MWLIILVCSCMLPLITTEKTSPENLNGLQLILRKHNQDVSSLSLGMKSNLKLLKDVQGFINSIGIGPLSENEDPCIGWIQFSTTRCIKILDELVTYDDALDACDSEFRKGYDKHLPELLTIPTAEVNTKIVHILENNTSVDAIWVHNDISDYSNFGNYSQLNLECIELTNDGLIRGQWFRVECEKENSVICEKAVTANYSQLVQKQIEFITELLKFEHMASGIIQKQKNVEERFNNTFEQFERAQKEHISNLKNSTITNKRKLTEDILTNSENILANSYALQNLTEYQNLRFSAINEKLSNISRLFLEYHAHLKRDRDLLGIKMQMELINISYAVSENSEIIRKIADETGDKLKNVANNVVRKLQIFQSKFKLLPTTSTTPDPAERLSVSNVPLTELETKTAASLPHPIWLASAIFDGNDSIYIFGGYERNEIYRFSISTNLISKVGNLPYNVYFGGTAINSAGNIIYLGGKVNTTGTNNVFSFDPTQNTLSKKNGLLNKFYGGNTFKKEENPDEIFLIGGSESREDYIRHFHTNKFSNLPAGFLKRSYEYANTIVLGGNAIILTVESSTIELLNLTTLQSVLLDTTIPELSEWPAVVTDGTFGYIIGGYNNTGSHKGGILRFNPVTFEHEFVPVKNFPGNGSSKFSGTSAVYVKKLNRIYLVGGYSHMENAKNVIHDKIWYIDLNSPETLPCVNKTNGYSYYPFSNTSNEDRFIGCENGTATVFSCPPPLVFDKSTASCIYPPVEEKVFFNCINKENGIYPHPESCEMFLGCQDGFLDVFKCPTPLIFDSIFLRCEFPGIAYCALKRYEGKKGKFQ